MVNWFIDTDGFVRKERIIIPAVVAIVALLAFLALNPFPVIGPGERGVMVTLGDVSPEPIPSGVTFRWPLVQSVVQMNVRTQTISYDTQTGDPLAAASKDLQDVAIALAVNYHVDPAKVVDIYRENGLDYQETILEPIVRATAKTLSSQFTAEELVTKRAEYSALLVTSLTEKFEQRGFVFEGVNITNLQFSQSFTAAIEAKVTAEQSALAQKNKLEEVKYTAQQQIETAKAEAESIKIKAAAVNAQGGADYVQLQAIEKWNGVLPAQMIPGSTVPFVDLTAR